MLTVAAGAERMHLQTSDGRFPADPQAIYSQWAELRGWVDRAEFTGADGLDPADLGSPAPAPRILAWSMSR
jgi:2,4-diketo-3-deoxy-L-fuconate hydrolase